MEAARLLEKGYSQSEVARRVGARRQSVSQWARQLEQGGRRALKKAGRAGRKPRLRPEDLRRIEGGLKRGPEALGYETGLWTSWRVAHLIEQECGVKYHPSQARRILRQLGWSCQRPVGRAQERDEEKIRGWKRERWPEIKKKPKKRGGTSTITNPIVLTFPAAAHCWAVSCTDIVTVSSTDGETLMHQPAISKGMVSDMALRRKRLQHQPEVLRTREESNCQIAQQAQVCALES